MKIAFSKNEVASLSVNSVHGGETLSQAIAGCKHGDWEGKRELARLFHPLITMLADKRVVNDNAARNALIERGRAGLYLAAKRFPQNETIRRFRLYALDHIVAAMDKPGFSLSDFFRRLK